MSLHHDAPVVTGAPRAWFKRWYQGPDVAIAARGLPAVRLTPNHPVLTHRGWLPARTVTHQDWVLGYHPAPTLPIGVWHEVAAEAGAPYRLDVFGRDFRGDSDYYSVETVLDGPGAVLGSPLVGEEGALPDVDDALVRGALAVLSSAHAFGRATWPAACEVVPGLEQMWPGGEPSPRSAGIPERVARRLGGAVAELPAPPVDHTAICRALLGLPGEVRLVPLDGVDTGQANAYVHDLIDAAGCYVAGGVVVA